MKVLRTLPILFALLTLSSVWVTNAQDTTQAPNTATPPLSAEDAAKLRQQLNQLGVVFGVDKPAAPVKEGEAPKQKNMAEVADRALSMVSGMIASVSQTVEKAAPQVWRIMIMQQYAKALGDIMTPFLLCLLVVGYYQFAKKKIGQADWSKSWYDSDWAKFWFSLAFPVIFGLWFGIWLSVSLSDSVKYLINPEYYAVRDILIMVMNPSQIQ